MHGGGAGGQPAFGGGGGPKDPWEVSGGQGLLKLHSIFFICCYVDILIALG